MSIMEQTSRCCMVCLMPHSQVSCSLENPHFNMFTLDRPICVRNRLSAFQVFQGFSAPAGRCSSAFMFRCTLASRGSSRSLRSSKRAAFAAVLMGSVRLMKLLTGRFRRARVFVGFRQPVIILQVSFILFFLLFPLCRGEAGLLVTAKYGYFRD